VKITLSSILKSLYLFFAPVSGLLLVVGLSTILDTIFGIAKAKKLGEPITSKDFRMGYVPKTMGYLGVVICIFLLDTLILNELIKNILDFDYFATKIVSLVLILNEVKSMDESWVVLKGYSFIDKFKESITQIKDIKKQIK